MHRLTDERGVALPLAMFVAFGLTALMAAAFTMVSVEQRIVGNSTSQLDAFSAAQTGLERFRADRGAFGFAAEPPAAYESTRVFVDQGYADVVLTRIRPSVDGSAPLYVLRSHGVAAGPLPIGGAGGERVVAQYAQWEDGSMPARAAFTSLTGLHKNGGSGTISGVDQCGVRPTVAGVSVPNSPGYTQSGGRSVPDGAPPIENMGTPTEAAAQITIDWRGVVDGTALTPDVSIPGDPWPSFADPNYWPIVKADGDFSLPTDGRGVLIVTDRLTIEGNKTWHGVVLVGEHVVGDGNNEVSGVLVSGLNIKLAADPDLAAVMLGRNSIGNGVKRIHYNSCFISQALQSFRGLAVYRNAWMDNWPVF